MSDENEGTGTEAAAAEEAATPEPTVFETMREKLDAGETIFGTVTEESGDAQDESAEGDEAAAEEGKEEGEAGAEGEDASTGEEEGAAADEEGDGGDADEAGEEGDGDDVTAEEGETVTVELSGRNEGETVEIEVDASDTELIETLRRTRNEGLRKADLERERATLQADRDEIEEIDIAMATDAAGFLLSKVAPEFRVQVAKALLLDDDVHEALQEIIETAEDPKERELLRLRLKSEREETAKTAGAKVRAAQAGRKAVERISADISGLVPSDMNSDRSLLFQRAALGVAEELTIANGKYATREQIVEGLRADGLLDRFGIKPGEAPGESKSSTAGTKTTASKSAAAKKAAAAKDKAQTVDELKKGRVRRKSIAGAASVGAGAPGASIELPKSTSIKGRIADVRKHGLAAVLANK